MAGAAVIGALRVVLGADTAAFDKGLKDAQSTLGDFGNAIGKSAAAIGIAMAGAAVALGVAIKGAINEADNLGKMAQKIGIPVKELSALKYVADLADLSLDDLAKSVGILSKNMSAIAGGAINPTAAALASLNISVKNSDGTLKSSSQVMSEVADRFSKMQDGAGKTALAMQIFGKSGKDMIPLLNSGKAGIEEMKREAELLGVTFDEKTSKAAEGFNDNLKRLSSVKAGISIQIMSALVPALERLTNTMVQVAKDTNIVKNVSEALTRTIVFLYDNVYLLGQAFLVLVGLKVAAAIVTMTLAFINLARAVITTGVAVTLLNAAKTLSIAKVAAFGAIVLWATGNLPAFTAALGEMGTAIRNALPADIGDTITKGLEKVGLDVKALSGDLSGLGVAGKQADEVLKNLKPPPIVSEEMLNKAKKIKEEIEKLTLQARLLKGDFDALAPGFIEAAVSMKLFDGSGVKLATTVAQLSPQLQQLNQAMLVFKGQQLTEDVMTPWEKYEQQLSRINQLLAAGAISQQTYGRAAKAAAQDSINMTTQYATEVGNALTTIFKGNKAASIAAAVINTAVAITKALSAYPPPWSFAMAALQAAAGAAQIAAIKSTSAPKFATGGSFKVGGVGGPDSQFVGMQLTPGEMVEIKKGDQDKSNFTPVNVTINGDVSRNQVRELFETLNNGMRDGYRLTLVPA